MAEQPPKREWTKQDRRDFQDLLDNIRALNVHTQLDPLIKPDNTGFEPGAISSPLDPTLIAHDERTHPSQIPALRAGDKPSHPEVNPLDPAERVGANKGDIWSLLQEMYGDDAHTMGNNRALVMPLSGAPLINIPHTRLPTGPKINVPGLTLPGGPLVTGLGLGKAPTGKLTVGDLLAMKAKMIAQAHGHGIVQRQTVA